MSRNEQFQAERERQHMQALLDKARDDLVKAQEATRKLDLARLMTIQAQKDAEGERD